MGYGIISSFIIHWYFITFILISISNFSVGTVSRNGTCFSSTECRDKSGRAAGGCAAG